MNGKRASVAALLLGAAFTVAYLGEGQPPVFAQEKKEKDPLEGKKGKTIGLLTAKGKGFIEVKAAGEEKARKYFPRWIGGAPDQGGGPEKSMVKTFNELKIGSRIEVDWVFEERLRAIHVKVLRAGDGKEDQDKKSAERKTGTVTGTLIARDAKKDVRWLEVKADGEEKARKYFLLPKSSAQIRRDFEDTPIGSRVRIEWAFGHGLGIVNLEVVAAKK
jgi:hypothetical protein